MAVTANRPNAVSASIILGFFYQIASPLTVMLGLTPHWAGDPRVACRGQRVDGQDKPEQAGHDDQASFVLVPSRALAAHLLQELAQSVQLCPEARPIPGLQVLDRLIVAIERLARALGRCGP
jgi:hypothetical protein